MKTQRDPGTHQRAAGEGEGNGAGRRGRTGIRVKQDRDTGQREEAVQTPRPCVWSCFVTAAELGGQGATHPAHPPEGLGKSSAFCDQQSRIAVKPLRFSVGQKENKKHRDIPTDEEVAPERHAQKTDRFCRTFHHKLNGVRKMVKVIEDQPASEMGGVL